MSISIKTLALKHYADLTMKQCRLLGQAVGYAKSTGTSPHTSLATDRLLLSLTLSRRVSKSDRLAVLRYVLEVARTANAKKSQTARQVGLEDTLKAVFAEIEWLGASIKSNGTANAQQGTQHSTAGGTL